MITVPTPRRALAALSICLLVLGSACQSGTTEEVETTTTVVVTTAPATRESIRRVVHATGIVSAAPGAELMVVAPEPARVGEIPHGPGDRVRRGDLLVRFDMPAAAAEVRRQDAEVRRAEADLDNARAARERAQDLFDRGVAARRDVEDAVRLVADADAGLAQARAAQAAAVALAERAEVRAPFDGVIASRSHNTGDLVEASAGDPVLRLVDPGRLEIVAAVPLTVATVIHPGAHASLVGGGVAGDAAVDLRVHVRGVAVDTGTATVPVRLTFTRPVPLPLGTSVDVDIDADVRPDAVTVPIAAIVREADATSVFVVTAGTARRRDVTTGVSDGTRIEIVDGVAAGDRVIIDGQTGLPDEVPVTEAAGSTTGGEG